MLCFCVWHVCYVRVGELNCERVGLQFAWLCPLWLLLLRRVLRAGFYRHPSKFGKRPPDHGLRSPNRRQICLMEPNFSGRLCLQNMLGRTCSSKNGSLKNCAPRKRFFLCVKVGRCFLGTVKDGLTINVLQNPLHQRCSSGISPCVTAL